MDAPSPLPGDAVHQLLLALPLQDLLHATAVCQLWHSVAGRVWRAKALARWQHWSAPPPAPADEEAWRELYRQRHAADADVLRLLGYDACWPHKQPATFAAIMERGADSLDVLAAATRSSSASSMLLSTAFHATCALIYLQAHLCGQQLQQLLAAHDGEPGSSSDPHQPEPPSPVDGAASAGCPADAAASGQDPLLEVALLLSQALHPLTDVAAVRRIISGLGAELQRRMHAARAAPGTRRALDLLNQLLFGQREQQQGAEGDVADGVARLAISRSSSTRGGVCGASDSPDAAASQPGWCAWSQQHQEVTDGADLSNFIVPTDGCSGCALQGTDMGDFYNLRNSELGYVLVRGRGLPITLALLHRAVGRAAGLGVHLLNTPRHIVNVVSLSRAGSGAGSSATAAAADRELVVVNPFDGGKVVNDPELSILLRGAARLDIGAANMAPLPPDAVDAGIRLSMMQPRPLARRMVANMANAILHQHTAPDAWDAAPELSAVPVVLLASRLQVGGQACVQLVRRCWKPEFLCSRGHAALLLERVLASFPDTQTLRALAPDICLLGPERVGPGLPSGSTPLAALVTWRERGNPSAPALVVSRLPAERLLLLPSPEETRGHVRAVREADTRLCNCAQPATAAAEAWAQGSYQAAYDGAQRLLRCCWFEAASLPARLASSSGSGEPEQPWAQLAQCAAAGKWVEALHRSDGGALCFVSNAHMQHVCRRGS